MTESPVSRAIAERGVAVGAMLYEFDTPRVMRILAAAGVDFALFDLEHTAWDAGTLRTLYATGLGTGVYPITRVVRAQYTLIATALDAGSRGIMAPMLESADEARLLVESAKYPPLGRRGFGVIMSDELEGGPAGMTERANRENLVIAQIESPAGIENAESIVSVAGVDAVWLGQFDLSLSLGHPRRVRPSPVHRGGRPPARRLPAKSQAARPDDRLDRRRRRVGGPRLPDPRLRRRLGVRERPSR